jgi:uncharacterized protein (DUF1684 family)
MGWIGGMGWMGRTLSEARKLFPAHPALLSVLATCLLLVSCSAPPPPDDPKDYAAKLASDRAAKDAAFTAGDDPIPRAKHAEFLPLAYFPIDPEFNVPAELKRIDDPTIVEMPTSTGTNRKMRRVGTLQFVLKGQPLSMLAFLEVGETSGLFVAFSDLTSGSETYPAGRFLDINRNATGIYELDFNRAYHPYCYYNPTYECPYPPRENRLKIPIRAGERMKKSEVGSLK